MHTERSPRHVRVEAVFAGEWPDRIPLCEQVIPSSVASELLGRPACTGSSELGYQEALAWTRGEGAHDEFLEQVHEDTLAIHHKLDLDLLRPVGVGGPPPTRQLDAYRFLYGDPDGDDWRVMKFDPESHQWGVCESSAAPPDMDEVVRIMKERIARGDRDHPTELSPALLRMIREAGDEFVLIGSSFMSIPMQPGWLEASLLEPELTAEYLDCIVEYNLAFMALQRRHGIRFMNGGGDFAYNTGPIYSPAFFTEVMAPRWKRMFDWCRANDAWYVFRSDGNLWPVAQSLFGWGKPHAYYEVDHDAGMTFAKLREAFPELVLIGNVSCDLLQRGTPEGVRRMTLDCLEAAAPRVIIASANSLLHGTPPENIDAMYGTAKQYRPAR